MQEDVLRFWFRELEPAQWWRRDEALDRDITARFMDLHAKASRCELYEWRREPRGRLAEIIVLDQFSRNIFRDSPRAFECDALALALAQEAVAAGADGGLDSSERAFLYMPYMHSESREIHEVAVKLFRDAGLEFNLEYELQHKAIVDRFGRYPHRNEVLGRTSTAEEIEFLKQPGSSF